MATLKYLIQSRTDISNIYLRYSISRGAVLKRKSGLIVHTKDWNHEKGAPKSGKEDLKALKSRLDKLAIFINDGYNDAIKDGVEINGQWLQLQIDKYNKKVPQVNLDSLINYIDKYINEAPLKQNAKKELGLSSGRVQNLKLFKSTITRFENMAFNGKAILIKEINLDFVEKFKKWLFAQNYSINYVGKNIANLRTICFDAAKNNIETSSQIKNIKGISEKKEPEDIIFLSEQEQEQIERTVLTMASLINARKWLLLGCLIGQRGGDLLNITNKNIREINGVKIIELKQQKTGKMVAIPLLPKAVLIVDSGMPYKTSLVHFNEYIKDICAAAEINNPTNGRKKLKNNVATTKAIFPKHKVISSHVCRRSFATNFYGRIPTPVLMHITAHGTEKMFLSYIGKTTYDNAYQMLEYFSKLEPKEKAMTNSNSIY